MVPDERGNYTYILQCSDGSLYTGWTVNLANRLKAHNSGHGSKYTKVRCPVRLVYYESFPTEHDARSREVRIKQMTRAQKLALIAASPFTDNQYKGSENC